MLFRIIFWVFIVSFLIPSKGIQAEDTTTRNSSFSCTHGGGIDSFSISLAGANEDFIISENDIAEEEHDEYVYIVGEKDNVEVKTNNRIEEKLDRQVETSTLVQSQIDDIENSLAAINSDLKNITSALKKNESLAQLFVPLETYDNDKNEYNSNFVVSCCLIFVVLVVILASVVYVLFYINRKTENQNKYLKEIIENNQEMQQHMIDKMELYTNASLQNVQSTSKFKIEDQHIIVNSIANRIAFMDVTMSKMDSSVRGFKQLAKSISQIKDSFKSYGYEYVEMLGKPYNPGMKVIANFVDDNTIPLGQKIITGVLKPQINYHGVMIQSAQITVSQNISEQNISEE